MNRYDVINALIQHYGLRSYLEIGYQNGVCFDRVECLAKLAIDPAPMRNDEMDLLIMSSDEYFNTHTPNHDIVFIDGLHDYVQVKRDFENCLKFAKVIVLHDMNPDDVEYMGAILTGRDRSISFCDGGKWNGDCYKLAIDLYNREYDLYYLTVDCDNGCGVVFNRKYVTCKPTKIINHDYDSFDRNRGKILNLVSEKKYYKLLSSGKTFPCL